MQKHAVSCTSRLHAMLARIWSIRPVATLHRGLFLGLTHAGLIARLWHPKYRYIYYAQRSDQSGRKNRDACDVAEPKNCSRQHPYYVTARDNTPTAIVAADALPPLSRAWTPRAMKRRTSRRHATPRGPALASAARTCMARAGRAARAPSRRPGSARARSPCNERSRTCKVRSRSRTRRSRRRARLLPSR
jgi:hypothetical protein